MSALAFPVSSLSLELGQVVDEPPSRVQKLRGCSTTIISAAGADYFCRSQVVIIRYGGAGLSPSPGFDFMSG